MVPSRGSHDLHRQMYEKHIPIPKPYAFLFTTCADPESFVREGPTLTIFFS